MTARMLELQSYCEFRDVGGLQVSPAFDCLPDRLSALPLKYMRGRLRLTRPGP